MKHKWLWRVPTAAVVSAAALLVASAAMGETPLRSTVENRVMLAFKVDDAAVQEMLPADWVPITLPKGPVAGANLIMSFFDRLLILDGEGNPADPDTSPAVALVAYGRQDGVEGIRTFIAGVFEVPPIANPFSNSEAADITRTASVTYGSEGRMRSEAWTVQPETGGMFSFDVSYQVTGYNWTTDGKSMPFSAADPAYREIYSYEQIAELAMNTTLGRELNGEVSYTAEVPSLAPLFDGSEALVAIVSVPVYVRQAFLP